MAGRIFTLMAAVLALLAAVPPARAAGAFSGSCVGSGRSVVCAARWGAAGGGFPYIVEAPGPANERAAAEAAERERQWQARCRPVAEQDRYGVARYRYAAAGCEFGRSRD
jgi:hypothetical protein